MPDFAALLPRLTLPAGRGATASRRTTWAVTVVALVVLLLVPQTVNGSWLRTLTEALLFAYYAQCWNLSSGFTGLPSFGHPIFVGVGAYTSSLLLIHLGLSPWIGMFAGAGLAAIAGAIIAVITSRLSISSVYFALFTMALWTVITAAVTVWDYIGGAQGLLVPLTGSTGDLNLSSDQYFYLILAFVVIAALITSRLLRSQLGLSLLAFRDDPDAARASGVSVLRTQVSAMVISAALTALAGAFYAMYYRFISPDDVLGFSITQTMILGTMVGGICTVRGPLVGGFVFGVLGSELRDLPFLSGGSRGDVFTTGVYAVLLVLTVRFLPRGLASLGEQLPRLLRRSTSGGDPPGDAAAQPAADRPPAGEVSADPAQTIASPTRNHTIPAGEPVLVASSLSVRIGGLQILDDVSLDVRPGEILAVIGPNGAGKTTLFNCLSGFMRPTSGEAVLDGSPVTASPTTLFQRGLGRTFQIAKPFPAMTAREAVAVASRPFARSYNHALELATSTLGQVEFAADYDTLGADLSNVNRKRLEVARALAGRPKVLLLDEVCAGLSSTEVRAFIEIVRKIAAQDVAIVMVEHVLEAVVALADRVHVLDYGKTIAEGDPATVMASPVVAEAYLGRSAVARRLALTRGVSS